MFGVGTRLGGLFSDAEGAHSEGGVVEKGPPETVRGTPSFSLAELFPTTVSADAVSYDCLLL
jgi:hypothetical protein